MDDPALDALRWQFEMTWRLAAEHVLPALTDEMCLWAPAPGAWTVRRVDGAWVPDWADEEPDPPPATSIAWITWQVAWWWSEALAPAEGTAPPGREGVAWPGSAEGVREQLGGLAARWRVVLGELDAEALAEPSVFPWAEPRPFALTLAWANAELMKNVAEIGFVQRLYQSAYGR